MTLRIFTVIGARPQFIKAAALSRLIPKYDRLEEILVHTGQHYDGNMSQVFFDELGIPAPEINLGIGSGNHGEQTGQMLAALENALLQHQPDCLLVYGDTNSTLAGALAAAKIGIPVAHVEAGLRSFNRSMPEEINRVLTDHLAEWLYAPTDVSVKNLAREGIDEGKVFKVGDVMFDAALYYGAKAEAESTIHQDIDIVGKEFVLATVHRAENTDSREKLGAIISGLERVSADVPVVWPMHPRTRASIERHGLLFPDSSQLIVIPPVGYLDMVMLEKHASTIVTDSGGVQKEAFFYQVPCVTLRNETEWVELVELGWNTLVPALTSENICEAVFASMGSSGSSSAPYGEGKAAENILVNLLDNL